MVSVCCRRCGKALEFSGPRPRFCAYCGQPLDESSPDETIDHAPVTDPGPTAVGPAGPAPAPPADRLAGYRLIRRIGGGGMGTVFEAEDEAHGRRVAVKVLNDHIGDRPEAIERFRQEGRLAAAISHPRCVFVLAADEHEGVPYIVMELMTGRTLQELVDRFGPLEPEEAVSRILDVIDGLTEAHRLGVIHRDVKPSNCFLEADGRVKVGDFGLSKSLVVDTRLTRTGSFLGTPLYASAEQIKGDPLDERTDVYSVCATLYFLLSGRPPFEAADAASVLARIVSEPPRPLREGRPEIPIGLEAVVLRGLERDRERRWRDLDELRNALMPFAPHPIPDAPIAARLGAFGVDLVLITALPVTVHLLMLKALPNHFFDFGVFDLLVWMAYFVSMEGTWGGSVGKRLFRLRVFRDDRRAEPGARRAAVRAAILFGVVFMPWIVAIEALEWSWAGRPEPSLPEFVASLVSIGLPLIGTAVIVAPMRRANGYRGLHERLSGTRTVRLPRVSRRREPPARRRSARQSSVIRRPAGVLDRVGPYQVRGAVRWDASRRVLAAEDAGLGREVWVVLRPPGSDPPDASRRELTRATRSRWLSGGEIPEGRWDAFTAPSGAPLADVAGPVGLPWSEVKPILVELVEELGAALADGTLPASLGVDQVWVEPDGRVQLVDPLGGAVPGPEDRSEVGSGPEDRRAIDLIRRVACLALEGGRRRSDDASPLIRAPVPEHARRWLDRLAGVGPWSPFSRFDEVRDGLRAIAGEPDELGVVPRANRAWILLGSILPRMAVAAVLLGIVQAAGLDAAIPVPPGIGPGVAEGLTFSAFFLAVSAAMAAASRCRWLAGAIGAVLVREDGLPPSRAHCALRELAIWAPPLAILLAVLAVRGAGAWSSAPAWSGAVAYVLPVAWILLEMAHELAFPGRMLHDRIARTRLVPL